MCGPRCPALTLCTLSGTPAAPAGLGARDAGTAADVGVAPPPGDGWHYHWEHDGDGKWFRFFTGNTHEVDGGSAVRISGIQYADGTITRSISIDGDTESLDAQQARKVAAALLDAADELDQLGGQE